MARFGPRLGASSLDLNWNMGPRFLAAAHADWTRVQRKYGLPFVVWLPFFFRRFLDFLDGFPPSLPSFQPSEKGIDRYPSLPGCSQPPIDRFQVLSAAAQMPPEMASSAYGAEFRRPSPLFLPANMPDGANCCGSATAHDHAYNVLQGVRQLGDLLPGLSYRQLSNLFGRHFAVKQSQQHTVARNPEYIAQYISNLDVYMLQQLFNAIAFPRCILSQLQPSPSKITEIANRACGI